jgi:type III secretion protein T
MDPIDPSAALQVVGALSLAAARAIGCMTFLPAFGRRHMSLVHRNAIAMAVSLPQAWWLWQVLPQHPLGFWAYGALALKETALGCLVGFLLAVPYWTVRSACTLIDNQRGANAAQVQNPSLDADASVLGELAERALIVYLCQTGMFVLVFEVLADTYALWPALEAWPRLSAPMWHGVVQALAVTASDALVYAAPALLLLIAIEGGIAIAGMPVKGLDVSQLAMPLKSLAGLMVLALLYLMPWEQLRLELEAWWRHGLLRMLAL